MITDHDHPAQPATAAHCRLRHERERGSISIWLALASFVMIVLVGLAVDLTGQVQAQQNAHDIAAQAARAGSQEINPALAIRGIDTKINPVQARKAAQIYLDLSGVQGKAKISNGGHTLIVTTSDTYDTKFLSIIGLNTMQVSGRAEARIAHSLQGGDR